MEVKDFMGRIEKNEKYDILTDLKQQTFPLVMWGCGDVADAVFEYLKDKVTIAAIWADGIEDSFQYKGYIVESIDAIMERYSCFNVILGHSQYDLGEELYHKYPNINKVYYVTNVHYQQYDNVKITYVDKEADRFCRLISKCADSYSVDNLFAYLNAKVTGKQDYIFHVHRKNMNFYNNDVYCVNQDESLIDIGAYDGDTIRLFLKETEGKYSRIAAFEPDTRSFLRLSKYVASERLRNVYLSMCGAWNKKQDISFKGDDEQLSSLDSRADSTQIVYADRIDKLFDEEVSLIKINYYVGVVEAIQGCEEIIKRYHPKMAIDVGFDIYNVLSVYEYIDSLDEGYKFYLRFNRAMSSTFTLYAMT